MYNSLLAYLGKEGAKKLFEMYSSINVSGEFIECLDVQLTKAFEESTGLIVKMPIWMGWIEKNEFVYNKGEISKLNARISLKHGVVNVWILWKSKSGRIYESADADIDCNDIEFWFEELDAELCRNYLNPKWSLFTIGAYKTLVIGDLKKHGIDASYEFLKCADARLTTKFTKLTGLKINQQVGLLVPRDKIVSAWKGNEAAAFVPHPSILTIEGGISKLLLNLSVFAHSNPVVILWQSKSGRMYQMSDTDIDCDDIEFWFEKLDTETYIEQYYPKGQKLPFTLKDLPYELVVTRLNIYCNLLLTMKEGYENTREAIIEEITAFTSKFNDASEKKSDTGEIVQNYSGKTEGTSTIVFEMDMSLAGFDYLKKLLKYLAKNEGIKRLEIA